MGAQSGYPVVVHPTAQLAATIGSAMSRFRPTVLLPCVAVLLTLLAACAPPEPVRVGFLGGLSGRVSDLGIKGRPIKLIEADDQQDPESARQAVARLIAHKVVAVVGPMTSAMASATLPLINQAQLPMVSPTVTTTDLSGLDDYFFRVIPHTSEFVATNADYYVHELGLRRIRLVHDVRNRAYSGSWLNDFRRAFAAAGGKLLEPLAFMSDDELSFARLAVQALRDDPDGVVIIGNSVDAAMLCRSIRRINRSVALSTSEWAAAERLIKLGGDAVEGITVAQLFDRLDTRPAYVTFRSAFVQRFGQEPGYAGVLAYDAANTVFDALESRTAGQTLKQALLAGKAFAGTQKTIVFDANGDTRGGTFISTIRHGAFAPLRPRS